MTKPKLREHPVAFVLQLFGDVRAGEAGTVLLMTMGVFLILTAYYLLKVAREPLILLGGGAEVKSYASVGQSILLIFVVVGVRVARGAHVAHVAHHVRHALLRRQPPALLGSWASVTRRSASRSSCGSASSTS